MIEELSPIEKENAGLLVDIQTLKLQLKEADERINILSGANMLLRNQLNEMKCCQNCKFMNCLGECIKGVTAEIPFKYCDKWELRI